jgi:hypothetical protein
MAQRPVVQVRLDDERVAFLDSLPGSRSEAIRYCVDFTHGAHMTPGQITKLVEAQPEPPAEEVVAPSKYADMTDAQLRREMKR